MKRIGIWFILLLFCVSLLTGCGEDKQPAPSTDAPTAKTEPSSAEAELNETEPVQTQPDQTQPTETEPSQAESTEPSDTEPVPTEPSPDDIQGRMAQEGAMCAVAYLGNVPGNFIDVTEYLRENKLTEALPVLKEISSEEFVEVDGTELYLVIPRSDMSITVYEQYMNWDTGELYWGYSHYLSFEPQPILMRGNISDTVTNMCVFLESRSGASLEYAPCISAKNGKLSAGAGVLDLTPYDLLDGISTPSTDVPEDLRVGTWYASWIDSADQNVYLTLKLQDDGTAQYHWGYAAEETMEDYSGSWQEQGDQIILELYGGMTNDPEMHHSLYCVFEWEYENSYLILHHVDAAALLMGTEDNWLYFAPSNFFALAGRWETYEYRGDDVLYNMLTLWENGELGFEVRQQDGIVLEDYQGRWSYEDGIMTVQMGRYGGANYDPDYIKTIAGSYEAFVDEYGWLNLRYIEGDMLTDFMSVNLEEYFYLLEE